MPDFRHGRRDPRPISAKTRCGWQESGQGHSPAIRTHSPAVSVSPGRELPIPRMGNDPCPISATGDVTHARFPPEEA